MPDGSAAARAVREQVREARDALNRLAPVWPEGRRKPLVLAELELERMLDDLAACLKRPMAARERRP